MLYTILPADALIQGLEGGEEGGKCHQGGSSGSSGLHLPIYCPHQQAPEAPLQDVYKILVAEAERGG